MDLETLTRSLPIPSHQLQMRSSLLVLAVAIALTACSSRENSQAGGSSGGTMIIDASNDAVDVFPPYVNDQIGRMVQDLVFDRLAEIGPELLTVGDKTFTP